MQHVIHAGHRRARDIEIRQIALDELDRAQVREVAPVAGDQTVGHAHALAAPFEFFGEMRADEACATGYQVERHVTSLTK